MESKDLLDEAATIIERKDRQISELNQKLITAQERIIELNDDGNLALAVKCAKDFQARFTAAQAENARLRGVLEEALAYSNVVCVEWQRDENGNEINEFENMIKEALAGQAGKAGGV